MATQAAEASPQQTPYEQIGGQPVINRIVERFYDLMDEEPDYAELRAIHAPDLTPMRKSLAMFLAAWCGGPRDWFDQNPGKCMMSAHKGVSVGTDTANQWADAMQRAIRERGPEDEKLNAEMADVLGRMARGMARK